MVQPQKEPLRAMSEQEEREVQRLVKATSERLDVVRRAKALVAVRAGQPFTEAAHEAGLKSGKGVGKLVKRFNTHGLAALSIAAGAGRKPTYTSQQQGRILQEVQRTPDREEDGTASWSLTTLQRALRKTDLPDIARETIRQVLHEAGYSFQQTRTWCRTGYALRKRKSGTVTTYDPETPEKNRQCNDSVLTKVVNSQENGNEWNALGEETMRKRKQPREYASVTRRFFRPEVTICLTCQTPLRRYATLSQRTVITLDGPVRLIHRGYRCPNAACPTQSRSYRSAAADALALPGFTFGLDLVILVGQLRLSEHHTLDEVHQILSMRLRAFALSMSRREVMYLFEAYCSLLRAAHQPSEDPHWKAWVTQVQENGGLLISLDGIQPDKGNETIYLVRDVLTGRVLCAENVRSSETEVMKQLLAPVVALDLPILGVISDAQLSERLAVAQLWPEVPHQTCQFHYLREAARPMHDFDSGTRVAMRKTIQNKLRETRDQLAHELQVGQGEETQPEQQAEREQLQVLSDFASGIQVALNLEGKQPFEYPGLAGYDALTQIEASLVQLEKKGLLEAGPSK